MIFRAEGQLGYLHAKRVGDPDDVLPGRGTAPGSSPKEFTPTTMQNLAPTLAIYAA